MGWGYFRRWRARWVFYMALILAEMTVSIEARHSAL
jgi:hypothetical protein